ncbi:PRP38 family protein, partial [Ostertagia ostertagi]
TNPQFLVEKIIRQRIYDSKYWKESCFALSGQFTLYARALGAMYLRLTFTSVEIYKYLEPLFNDYRKLRYMNKLGRFELVYMDEFIDNLLREERYCDIQLPRLQKRQALEEAGELEPYRMHQTVKMKGDRKDKKKEKPRLISRRRSRSRDRSRERERPREKLKERERDDKKRERSRERDRDRDRDRDRHERDRHDKDRDRRRDRSRERDRERDRDRDRKERERPRRDERDRDDRDHHRSKKSGRDDGDREIAEANALRAKLGLNPLER